MQFTASDQRGAGFVLPRFVPLGVLALAAALLIGTPMPATGNEPAGRTDRVALLAGDGLQGEPLADDALAEVKGTNVITDGADRPERRYSVILWDEDGSSQRTSSHHSSGSGNRQNNRLTLERQ